MWQPVPQCVAASNHAAASRGRKLALARKLG